MPVVHYNSGVFYAWIDGVLQTIPIGGGGSVTNIYNNPTNQPLLIDERDEPFEPILFNQRSLDNVAYINRTNAFTGANSFSTLIDLTSGQLKFPSTQNPSADANTLDDYEEGTWTPVIGGSGGESGQVYGAQIGLYQKIGNTVHIFCRLALTTLGTITGNVQIMGLPFAARVTPDTYPAIPIGWGTFTTACILVQGLIVAGTSIILLRISTAAQVSFGTAAVQANLANTSSVNFSASYQVD